MLPITPIYLISNDCDQDIVYHLLVMINHIAEDDILDCCKFMLLPFHSDTLKITA